MGVDIFGKAFDAEYEADSKLFDEIGAEAHLNMPPEDRPWQPGKPGRFFQTSWWTWRPMADFICREFPRLASGCTYWQSTEGDGLGARAARELGRKLKAMVEDGRMADLIALRNAALDAVPDQPCQYCRATGMRTDIKPHPTACNACGGSGALRPDATIYRFNLDDMKRFAEFCIHSGGFEIH